MDIGGGRIMLMSEERKQQLLAILAAKYPERFQQTEPEQE